MSTDQGFEEEFAQVKAELSKLKGQTVFTLSNCDWNTIEDDDSSDGLKVKTKHTKGDAELIEWGHIEKRYSRLCTDSVFQTEAWYKSSGLKPPRGRSAFCRAVFALVTTGKVYVDNGYTGVKYVPGDNSPRLRPQEEWPCPHKRT